MWNDITRPYRDDIATWTDVPSEQIKEDWDRIGWYYIGFYRASGRTIVTDDGERKTHRDPKFLFGRTPTTICNRKIMNPSIGNVENPALPTLEDITINNDEINPPCV
jgi:hypothetical protein